MRDALIQEEQKIMEHEQTSLQLRGNIVEPQQRTQELQQERERMEQKIAKQQKREDEFIEQIKKLEEANKEALRLGITAENKCTLRLADESSDEYKEVKRCYEFNPVYGYTIDTVEIIENLAFKQKFEITQQQLQARQGKAVFKSTWETLPENADRQSWRKRCYEFFKELSAPFKDVKYPNVEASLLWHGTTLSAFTSIQETGYVNLATTDDNFFGEGIYNTVDAEYAHRVYAAGPAARKGEAPVLLMNLVACFSTHPQIERPWAAKEAW